MENKLIIEPASKIREIARAALKGHWKEAFLGIFIYYILSSVVGLVLDCFFYSVENVELLGETIPMTTYYASAIYQFILAGPLQIGILMFLLAFFRKHTVEYTLTFEGFSVFGKAFLLYVVYTVRVFLWTLLFFIPGLIAALRYNQAFYLCIDHPEWGINQCLAESSRLMKGNKMKLFCLDLSFLGWYFLTALVVPALSLVNISKLALVALTVVFSLPTLVVDLYKMVAETAFYELLTGNLVVQESNPFEENL